MPLGAKHSKNWDYQTEPELDRLFVNLPYHQQKVCPKLVFSLEA
jgi:hypothetical protein